MNYEILSNINSPGDLKKLPKKDIHRLAGEIRSFLVENIEKTGGHLASNLGVTELTLAVHRVFDSPKDHIIFDVGHQAYVHKLLTGRRERFGDLRKPGGLSGFTLRRESVHDPFGAGHSSTSVSAALGFAEADVLSENDAYTVCILGDGAYTGGMIHEALNNCKLDLKMVIIINENGMSISNTKGAFASLLARVRISARYTRMKQGTTTFLEKIPLIGKPIKRALTFVKEKIKKMIYAPNYFEQLGLYYLGPIDGNNYDKIEKALNEAKRLGKTVVVHVKTQKGKGYAPAEKSPDEYHSLSSSTPTSTFHSVFADELINLAERDNRILAVTAAMGIGTGLDLFGTRYPERYFDVGIAEEHALTFSAGLAAAGYKPFVAIYSTFLQRAYDSILHDVALQSLPVRMLIDRAGLSSGDGATHHGIFDVSFLSHIPNVEIFAPATYRSLRRAVDYAATVDNPIAIRYSNVGECERILEEFKYYQDHVLINFDADNIPSHLFITYGNLASRVMEAADIVNSAGKSCGVVIVERLKPCKSVAASIKDLISKSNHVIYAEEGIRNGGAAMLTMEQLIRDGADVSENKFQICAIDDHFASPAEICDIYDYVGLSAEKLSERMISYDQSI